MFSGIVRLNGLGAWEIVLVFLPVVISHRAVTIIGMTGQLAYRESRSEKFSRIIAIRTFSVSIPERYASATS